MDPKHENWAEFQMVVLLILTLFYYRDQKQ